MTTLRTTSDRSTDALPTPWQRLPALSGVAFAVLMLIGWFISGSDTPNNYTATDQEWTKWADDNQTRSRIGAFLTLTAGLMFLHFAVNVRSALGGAKATIRGSVQLARVAFAGALIAITGITMAIVTIAGATAAGGFADPVVSRAVATTTVGPFLVAAMGFAALLSAAGLSTLRSGVFPRWVGIVALVGGLAFFVTFFTLVVGPDKDSVFGYGFFVGFITLAIWSIGTSLAIYRFSATTAH